MFAEGPDYEGGLAFYRRRGSTSAKPHIVLVKVSYAAALVSPAYDSGQSEAAVIAKWRAYWADLWSRRQPSSNAALPTFSTTPTAFRSNETKTSPPSS